MKRRSNLVVGIALLLLPILPSVRTDHPRIRFNNEIFAQVSTFIPKETIFAAQDIIANGLCQSQSMSTIGQQVVTALIAGIMPQMSTMMPMGACFMAKTFTSPVALLPGAEAGISACLESSYNKMVQACAKTKAKGNASFVSYLYRMHRIAYRKLGWGLMQRCLTDVCQNIQKGYLATFAGCASTTFLWGNHTLTC